MFGYLPRVTPLLYTILLFVCHLTTSECYTASDFSAEIPLYPVVLIWTFYGLIKGVFLVLARVKWIGGKANSSLSLSCFDLDIAPLLDDSLLEVIDIWIISLCLLFFVWFWRVHRIDSWWLQKCARKVSIYNERISLFWFDRLDHWISRIGASKSSLLRNLYMNCIHLMKLLLLHFMKISAFRCVEHSIWKEPIIWPRERESICHYVQAFVLFCSLDFLWYSKDSLFCIYILSSIDFYKHRYELLVYRMFLKDICIR